MSLLFIDGFDHYATADFSKKLWTTAGGAMTINATGGRRGGGSAKAGSTSQSITRSITASGTVIIGFAITGTALTNTSGGFVTLLEGATTHLTLMGDGASHLQVRRGTTSGTVLGTSSNAFTNNTYYYFELRAKIDDTAGAFEVRVNGANWLALGPDTAGSPTVAVDTKNGGTTGLIDTVTLGLQFSGHEIDDLYICNSSGSTNNDFLGDCRVDLCTANGEGSHLDFTPSTGSTHYALVDESTPNTSDYNSSNTVGAKDSYTLTDLAAVTGSVFGAQALAAVLKDDAGARSAKVGLRTNTGGSPGSTVMGSALALSTSQLYALSIAETDPSTGIAWTEAGLNGAELVVEVSA